MTRIPFQTEQALSNPYVLHRFRISRSIRLHRTDIIRHQFVQLVKQSSLIQSYVHKNLRTSIEISKGPSRSYQLGKPAEVRTTKTSRGSATVQIIDLSSTTLSSKAHHQRKRLQPRILSTYVGVSNLQHSPSHSCLFVICVNTRARPQRES